MRIFTLLDFELHRLLCQCESRQEKPCQGCQHREQEPTGTRRKVHPVLHATGLYTFSQPHVWSLSRESRYDRPSSYADPTHLHKKSRANIVKRNMQEPAGSPPGPTTFRNCTFGHYRKTTDEIDHPAHISYRKPAVIPFCFRIIIILSSS
jgi:hypothetical protein